MATRILKVEVENDFLNKVSNSGAYTAISELVWNSLDADASTVKSWAGGISYKSLMMV